MKLLDLLENIKYDFVQGENLDILDLSIDSRNIDENTLFFCIKGINIDGHSFINEVSKINKVAVVIEDYQPEYPNVTVIKVDNVRKEMSKIASTFYGNIWKKFDIIGITGTNGKTSVSYFVESVLKQAKQKTGVIGTLGNKVGNELLAINTATSTTPDAIELQKIFKKMSTYNVDSVIMEVSSHALALDKVEGLEFKIGVFTNITPEHLDFHNNMDNYLKEKTKLFSLSNWGIINNDSEFAHHIISNSTCKILTYSIDKESDLKASNISYSYNGISFEIEYDSKKESFFVPLIGKFSLYNALATIGVALSMDIQVDDIRQGLKNIKQVPGRIQRVHNDKGIYSIVDYAHTPDGLENVINSIKEIVSGKLITVFGCGGDRDKTKRPIMGEIAGDLSDYCIITSDNPRSENPESIINEIEVGIKRTSCEYEKVVDREVAISLAIDKASKGDAVLVCGKGHEKYQIFKDITIDFDDCLIIENAINILK